MSSSGKSFSSRWSLPLGVFAALAVSAAMAQVVQGTQSAAGTSGIDSSGNHQKEVQACKEGRTGQNESTCLLEARNAQAARQRGQLTNPSTDFQANAMARCQPLQGDDKAACEARMMGHGEVSGSVAGGGLLREIETVVPSTSGQAPAQSAPAAQSGSTRPGAPTAAPAR